MGFMRENDPSYGTGYSDDEDDGDAGGMTQSELNALLAQASAEMGDDELDDKNVEKLANKYAHLFDQHDALTQRKGKQRSKKRDNDDDDESGSGGELDVDKLLADA